MKIHFDDENANVEITFADDFEKEWANKNPEIFGKTISDIKEMHVSNNALAATKSNNEKEIITIKSNNEKEIIAAKSNNEKEIRISDNEKALAISKNIIDTINNGVSVLSNYFTNINFDEVPNIPVN